jgi:hypothetical protein
MVWTMSDRVIDALDVVIRVVHRATAVDRELAERGGVLVKTRNRKGKIYEVSNNWIAAW